APCRLIDAPPGAPPVATDSPALIDSDASDVKDGGSTSLAIAPCALSFSASTPWANPSPVNSPRPMKTLEGEAIPSSRFAPWIAPLAAHVIAFHTADAAF